jgi:uncharacterized membrane protein YphA (DoxX/SURF4 family)
MTRLLPYPQTYANWLAILRIYTGIFWLTHGIPKLLNPGFATPDGMMAGMIGMTVEKTSGAYHDFLVHTVLPNAPLFGHLVAWGETLTGVSLLLGLLTRVGGIGGTFLALNYWLMKSSFATVAGYGSLDIAAIALSLTHAVLPTGLVAGLDGALSRRTTSVTPEQLMRG